MQQLISYLLVISTFVNYWCEKTANAEEKKTSESVAQRFGSLEVLAHSLHYLESMYVDPSKSSMNDLVTTALKGMVASLDPHTLILPKKAFQQMTNDTRGKYGGIGIIVSEERGKLIVISPIDNTPAHKAGIKTGDEILKIDGKSVNALKEHKAMDSMRGKPGTTLKLSIKRRGQKKILNFEMVREIIKVKSVQGRKLDEGLYHVKVTSFQEETSDELKVFLESRKENIKGLVLDLRDNPGGLLDQAVRLTDLFVESGIIVSTVGRDADQIEREFALKRGTFADFPMVVLVNGGSASASEIVAGALQDHGRALIMGNKTFGKGSVQTLLALPDGSGLKITVARYYTPLNRTIQAKGITPDINVSNHITQNQSEARKAESDLERHIQSKNILGDDRKKGFDSEIAQWDSEGKKDQQLKTAYRYLKGWQLFNARRTQQ